MRVLVAGAALKGTLDCIETTEALSCGVREAGHEPVPIPIADGGDGSLTALRAAGFAVREASAHDAMGRQVSAAYAWHPGSRTAAVELAQAAGLWRVQGELRDPWRLTTYGFGELLLEAISLGPRTVLALLGGSATQDAGAGMLQALGAALSPPPEGFADAAWLDAACAVDLGAARERFRGIALQALTDVDHFLAGPRGSAYSFAAQKGFRSSDLARLDDAIARFGRLLAQASRIDVAQPGSGAAGGVGAALLVLGARRLRGAQVLMEAVGFFRALAGADALVTCEGQVDETTWQGKAPGLAAEAARSRGLPAVVVCAREGPGARVDGVTVARAGGSPAGPEDLAHAARRALSSTA